MVSFVRRRRHTSSSPRLKVNGDLKPGTYRFQLQVTDDSGNRSRPVILKVIVLGRQRRRRGPGLGLDPGRRVLDVFPGGFIRPPGRPR